MSCCACSKTCTLRHGIGEFGGLLVVGKLVCTWPTTLNELPAWHSYCCALDQQLTGGDKIPVPDLKTPRNVNILEASVDTAPGTTDTELQLAVSDRVPQI